MADKPGYHAKRAYDYLMRSDVAICLKGNAAGGTTRAIVSFLYFVHHRLIETPRERKRGHWEALSWAEWRRLSR